MFPLHVTYTKKNKEGLFDWAPFGIPVAVLRFKKKQSQRLIVLSTQTI